MNGFRGGARQADATREIELDVTRGVAILLAMGWHFNDVRTGIAPVDWLMAPGRLFGWAGVDLFFVLSGFLVGRLVFQEYDRTGEFLARRFLVRRALKIWPILYFFLLCQLILGFKPWESYFLQTALHVQNYFETPILHLWSLAVEEQFYLTFAVVFGLLARTSRNPETIIKYAAALLFVVPALRILALTMSVDPVDIQWQTQYRMDALAFGVILAGLSVFHRPVFDRLASSKKSLLCVTIAGCSFLSLNPLHSSLNESVGFTVAYLTAAAFLLLCYRSDLILKRQTVFQPLAAIGVYSYAMYIWHPGMVRAADYAAPYLSGVPLENLWLLLLRYSGAIVVAIVVTKAIEKPFLMIRDRAFPRPEGGTNTAQANNTIRGSDAPSLSP